MNSRERILAAMRRQPVDRIPFVPLLNGYCIRSFPEHYQTLERWQVLRELGIDLLVRFRKGTRIRPPLSLMPPPEGPLSLAPSEARDWASSQPVTDKVRIETASRNGTQYVTVDTPVGRLRCGWRYTAESPDVPFPVEHLLKTIDDVRVYRYVLDQTVVEPAYDEIVAALEGIGDEGTCEAAGGPTPMQELIEYQLGMAGFYYSLNDYPVEMEALMTHMLDVRKQEYRLLAESPAPIVITGEDTSTTMASPGIMARWEFPVLDEYSDIVHRGGKIHVVHMCGKLRGVMDLLTEARFDGVHDVSPPPIGDFDFRTGREQLCAAGKCLIGGIDAGAFQNLTPEEVEIYVSRRLEEVAPGTGFLLGSGDTVPFGTSLDNLRAVVCTVEQRGRYPLEKR